MDIYRERISGGLLVMHLRSIKRAANVVFIGKTDHQRGAGRSAQQR
jgi:hypothetical protein